MTDKPRGPKPFLSGEDELSTELDAWDATFDALHTGPEGGAPSNEQVMAWPTPTPTPTPAAPPSPSPSASDSLEMTAPRDLHSELELDEPHTLDRAVPEPAPRASTWDAPAEEADFSGVGAEGVPSALGEILGGRAGTLPPIDDENEAETRIDIGGDGPDDGVYTSASRPGLRATSEDFSVDDPIAPPPRPAPEKPRGPAIIRRTVGVAAQTPGRATGGYDAQDFSEETRIGDPKEMRANEARSKAPTAPPPFASPQPVIDEDDYADIEIGADAPASSGVPGAVEPEPSGGRSAPTAAPRRTVAHVVRREVAARPAPALPARPSASVPVIEMDADDGVPARPASMSEDDFSDVAAAVGAGDEPLDPAAGARGRFDVDIVDHDDIDAIDDNPGLDATLAELSPRAISVVEVAPEPISERSVDDEDDDDAMTTGEVEDDAMPTGEVDPEPVPSSSQSLRPPALTDLYPRVKLPTSVPPLGSPMASRTMPGRPGGGIPRPDPGLGEPTDQHSAAEPFPDTETLLGVGRAPVRSSRRLATPVTDLEEPAPELEPLLDLEAIQLPEQVQPLPSSQLDEDAAGSLLVYEREIATVDDSAASAALRIEAGRLSERLGDLDRARAHYDAAMLVDPRATAALRGLRRIARGSGDLVEATRQLDAEIEVAGALERTPLGHYRVDLLMASGEQDLARVAVGEILDSAPSDVRALLAQLELAFLDGRADEFGRALEQLADAITDTELRAAVQSARGLLAAHHDDSAGAATWFAAAAEADPGSHAARLGAIRQAIGRSDAAAVAKELLELARQVESADPTTAAALAVRALGGDAAKASIGETALAAAELASRAAPNNALVARAVAEALNDVDAYARWARTPAAAAERAYAAARAAELDPSRGTELWGFARELDPGDDYAAAQLRTSHVVAEAPKLAIDVDLADAGDPDRERARLRAAYGMIALGELDGAIDLLAHGRSARRTSLALAEALAEALAAAGRWNDRAVLLGELAAEPGDQLDRDVAQLRSALAWEEAVGAAAAVENADPVVVQRATVSALEAWERVLEPTGDAGAAASAHAATLALAMRLGDRDTLVDVLARAQAAERSPWAASSLALRRARLVADADPSRADAILRETSPIDDPRRTVALVLAAARAGEIGEAAGVLEERAAAIVGEPNHQLEAAALRLRAAQLALDAGDAGRATALLGQVEKALPQLGVVPDLLAAARRRSGDRPTSTPQRHEPSSAHGDAFARIVRDADLAAGQGDAAGALGLYQRALELHPGDPLATVPLIRVATELGEPAPITQLALAQLRAAEERDDAAAKATAYELLAQIDGELRSDVGSAQIALESAAQADPARVDIMHRLEREYAATEQIGELLRLRKAELAQLPAEHVRDRAALIVDTAQLATRDRRPDVEVADLYRSAVEADPKNRMALHHLESIVRRGGASPELAKLEEQVANYFDGDPRSGAAFWTRAGETLAELGQIDAAVGKFGKADELVPGHVPALEGWRAAALKGQLWVDVAEAANRQAAISNDAKIKGQLHHFAGVALMDKALINDQAQSAFKKALDADPSHRDSFLRLRILLEEDAAHDELAILLSNRLDYETDPRARIALHRAVAELSRNFLSDRETAVKHYREILVADPNDLRAHMALADIAWELGNWQEAADALMQWARLERDPATLKTLCYRLGLIYADRLVDIPMALKAFQRALTYQPDDENTLTRLADLATTAGEWKLALGACERLVKNEHDPDKRALHLHRVAKIFKTGFNDAKRAERALNLALDGAPTSDTALSEVVTFYRDAGDMTSVRVHLNRVAGAMRTRIATEPKDGVAYRVIARSMLARANAGVETSLAIARSAAELAQLFGAGGEPEAALLADNRVDPGALAALIRPDSDEILFPRSVSAELRQVFQLLGDRVAKHVGVDLRSYGVARGDRLRAKDSKVAAAVQDVASALGFGDVDVYLSARQPYAMVAEPTSPVSVVIGQSIAQGDARGVRFAAGSALKLAQSSLAIPARLGVDELGVMVVALLRLFQPEFPIDGIDPDAVGAQLQKLRRLIPTGLMNELKPYAAAVDNQLRPRELARDLRVAGARAGLLASGSLRVGLEVLAAAAELDLQTYLADPVAQGLLAFALGEDHATLSR